MKSHVLQLAMREMARGSIDCSGSVIVVPELMAFEELPLHAIASHAKAALRIIFTRLVKVNAAIDMYAGTPCMIAYVRRDGSIP